MRIHNIIPMISNTAPNLLPASAPAVLHRLREVYDDRLMDLYRKATAMLVDEPPPYADRTVHVPFTHDGLQVIAVYHAGEQRFTQLIARDALEVDLERPSYTLSLFL
jgi:hypothetical protein